MWDAARILRQAFPGSNYGAYDNDEHSSRLSLELTPEKITSIIAYKSIDDESKFTELIQIVQIGYFVKRIIFPVLILSLIFTASTSIAQPKPYYGPLLYSMSRDTSVPPVYEGESQQVRKAYQWFDGLLRSEHEPKIWTHFRSIWMFDTMKYSWTDTERKIARNLYLIQDDNPLARYMWSGKAMHPNPYKRDPGQAMESFENRAGRISHYSKMTYSLLTPHIIADVIVDDTICVKDPTAYSAFDMVLVNSTILDAIKGKQVPFCVEEGMRALRKKGTTIKSSGTIPWPTHPVPADTGTCLQFEYSPGWFKVYYPDEDYGPRLGWWVKPCQEYIVFLNIMGVGLDSTSQYFTISPGGFGSSGGMYPVIDGIVEDPGDDFGIGAKFGLSVDEWKARIRARIDDIINP